MTQHIFPRVNEQANALRNVAALPYRDLLDGEIVRSALVEENLKFRVRRYSPLVTLWTFLTQVLDSDHSCRKAVSSLGAFLVSQGQPAVSPDTSNYCKAEEAPSALLHRKAGPEDRGTAREEGQLGMAMARTLGIHG